MNGNKIRQDAKVISKAAYSCMGINIDGRVDVLGIRLSDLKSRGVTNILIACIDGLKGFPQAMEAIFPKTRVQLWVVHQIRTSLRYLGSKYHKELMVDLKEV